MSDAAEIHARQVEYWNGPAGQQWAQNEARTERALTPVTKALLEAAAAQAGERVLDVGCGCGGSTRAFAEVVGPTGHVTGADVAVPMIEVARANAPDNIDFVLADVAAHGFAAPYDLMVSRFGVMFFGDPDAAFGNIRRALKPGGRVAFACWRPMAENPWVRVPMGAIAPVLPEPPPRPGPEDPGPFAFGDQARVRRIMAAGGFHDVALTPFDFDFRFPGTPAEAAKLVAYGPVTGRLLRELPPATQEAAIARVAEAIAPMHADGMVRLAGAVWIVTARA